MRTTPGASLCRLFFGLAAGSVFLLSGCVTTSNPWAHVPQGNPAPKPATASRPAAKSDAGLVRASGSTRTLRLGDEMDWIFENAPDKPGVIRVGRTQVGPDGTVVIGPYGNCAVAGLTEAQAARKVETLLRAQFRNPRIRVETIAPLSATSTAVWRKSGSTSDVRVSSGDPDVRLPLPAGKPEVASMPVTGAAPGGDLHPAGHRLHHKKMMAAGFAIDSGAPSEMSPTLLPPYVIGPPDVLLIQSRHALLTHPIQGQHLVRPDGTVGLSIYGAPVVAGLTLDEARDAIARVINPKLKLPKDIDEKTGKITSYFDADEQLKTIRDGLVVDVLAYNSKVYYVITDGGGYGEQVVRLPITGGETVLDAISQVNGLSPVSSKYHVWIARRGPGHGAPDGVLRVDWVGITQRGATATNYQIMPGDRLYVKADRWRAADALVAKVLAPFERILGVTLLGSQTVNSIRNPNGFNNNP